MTIEMEDFKVVDVSPHGHIHEHAKYDEKQNMTDAVDGMMENHADKQ